MKNFIKTIAILLLFISMTNCDQDPCDVDHAIVDGECIPYFIYPQNANLKSGARFYHEKFGVVIFENGHWFDENNHSIAELEIKNN